MIDLQNETVIPVLAVRKILPVSTATIRRWVASGRLEVIRAGAKVLTSREAIQRMCQQGPQLPHHRMTHAPKRDEQSQAATERLAKRFAHFA